MTDKPQEETQSVEKALAEYENMIALRDLLALDLHQKCKEIIPVEVSIEIENIESEYTPKLEQADKKIEALKKSIQEQAKVAGQRVDGQTHQVIIQKPSWSIGDIEGLLEFAVKVPQVMKYLKKSGIVVKIQARRSAE